MAVSLWAAAGYVGTTKHWPAGGLCARHLGLVEIGLPMRHRGLQSFRPGPLGKLRPPLIWAARRKSAVERRARQ
jgi:hypothetical protein